MLLFLLLEHLALGYYWKDREIWYRDWHHYSTRPLQG